MAVSTRLGGVRETTETAAKATNRDVGECMCVCVWRRGGGGEGIQSGDELSD